MSTPDHPRSFTLRGLLVVATVLALGFVLLVPYLRKSREAAYRTRCTNNVRQIGIAIQNFHDIRQEIAPSYLTDDHSPRAIPSGFMAWPTIILPFMEQSGVYDLVDNSVPLDEPAPPPADHGLQVRDTIATYICPTRCIAPALTLGPIPYAVGDYGSVSLADAVDGQVDRGAPRTWDAAMTRREMKRI